VRCLSTVRCFANAFRRQHDVTPGRWRTGAVPTSRWPDAARGHSQGMRLRHLPGSSTPFASIVLGTAVFGSEIPADASYAMLDAYAAAGGNLLDTAHVYASWLPGGTGASEQLIGRWLADRGLAARIHVATKGAHPALSDMSTSRLRPQDIASDLSDSLDRLRLDRIALYYLHRDDETIPVDEVLAALQPHLRNGTVGAIGASNWGWRRIAAANACAAARGWTGFAASQINWSLGVFAAGHRHGEGLLGMDAETIAYHGASGVVQIPFSAQANGFFGKPLAVARQRLPQYEHPASIDRWHVAQRLAARYGVSANAVALAWLLQHPQGGWGIVGPKRMEQLQDSLTAADLVLDPAAWQELDAPAL
jgi:aryl-alcohol dehydrogenase-like predicted oxidoreductase